MKSWESLESLQFMKESFKIDDETVYPLKLPKTASRLSFPDEVNTAFRLSSFLMKWEH